MYKSNMNHDRDHALEKFTPYIELKVTVFGWFGLMILIVASQQR